MAASRHLRNAPIHEAIVDFRVTPSEATTVENLELVAGAISEAFPVKKPTRKFEGGFRILPTPSLNEVRHSHIGYRLETPDGRRILQIRTDGFTFSWLRPYDSWEALIDLSRPLWSMYIKSVQPVAVTRIATRFINRIELPIDGLDFDDYLTSPPPIPRTLPQSFNFFLSRVAVALDQRSTVAVITQSLESVVKERRVLPYILDIDVFREESLSPGDSSVWAGIESFRKWKNEAFFGSLTERTVEAFA